MWWRWGGDGFVTQYSQDAVNVSNFGQRLKGSRVGSSCWQIGEKSVLILGLLLMVEA
jgi:hypothetical protein